MLARNEVLCILDDDGQSVVPLGSDDAGFTRWFQWMDTHDRQIAQVEVGNYFLSTVFLGVMLTNRRGMGTPFETMLVPDGDDTRACYWRFTTYEDAAEFHAEFANALWQAHRKAPDRGVTVGSRLDGEEGDQERRGGQSADPV